MASAQYHLVRALNPRHDDPQIQQSSLYLPCSSLSLGRNGSCISILQAVRQYLESESQERVNNDIRKQRNHRYAEFSHC